MLTCFKTFSTLPFKGDFEKPILITGAICSLSTLRATGLITPGPCALFGVINIK